LVRLTPDALLSAMAAFTALPGLWEGTGCFHRAGLFDPVSGAFTHTVEDVGRHNCLDRLAGHLLDLGQSPRGFAVFLTARITASMAAKAARAGFPMLVSRSAVTHTALETDSVPTLVGFTRGDRFTVFSDPAGHVAERAGGLAP
jgi:FdhD protein